ncbi:MAG: tetratricopeptide repeat protein, partial [Pseudodesulfovibrio sp.]
MHKPPSVSPGDAREMAATLGPGGAVRCVFSSLERIKVGTGVTTRGHASKLLWFVEGLGEGRFSLRKLNDHHVPTGEGKVIGLDRLLRDYAPEVEHYEQYTLPAMELLEDFLDEGEGQRVAGKLYSAEGSFRKALGLDEQNVRALFNLGLVYMAMEDADRTRDLMRSLLTIRSAFTGKDQHLFNEFGISLRKHGLFREAVEYYSRALDYAPDDDHLLF